MVNANRLKAAMLTSGYETVEEAAKAIGMHPQTMYRKLKAGIFGSDEIQEMISAYSIEQKDLCDIFFAS